MKKQFILAGAGILTVTLLLVFGRTTEHKKSSPKTPVNKELSGFNILDFIDKSKQTLPPSQILYLSNLENSLGRADDSSKQLTVYNDLANFWKDSAHIFEAYAFCISKAAKLDNSEKKLTFAAQLFLDNLRGEHDATKLGWEKAEAISLFEAAIKLNPSNDDLRIGLGSCYVFGAGPGGNAQETMKGIQELLGVVRRDSNNMKAQLVLGVGGYVSTQYDKAIERFKKVIAFDPNNIEAIAFLADTYAAKGEKEEAIKWYNISKRLVNNPRYSQEVDERIKMMK